MKAEFFYAGNRLVECTDPGWIQSVFGMLTGLFEQVGIRTNIRKTVGVVCRPFRESGLQADKVYTRRL